MVLLPKEQRIPWQMTYNNLVCDCLHLNTILEAGVDETKELDG